MSDLKRKTIIQELRHQLHYMNPGPAREEVRCQLEYWLYYSHKL